MDVKEQIQLDSPASMYPQPQPAEGHDSTNVLFDRELFESVYQNNFMVDQYAAFRSPQADDQYSVHSSSSSDGSVGSWVYSSPNDSSEAILFPLQYAQSQQPSAYAHLSHPPSHDGQAHPFEASNLSQDGGSVSSEHHLSYYSAPTHHPDGTLASYHNAFESSGLDGGQTNRHSYASSGDYSESGSMPSSLYNPMSASQPLDASHYQTPLAQAPQMPLHEVLSSPMSDPSYHQLPHQHQSMMHHHPHGGHMQHSAYASPYPSPVDHSQTLEPALQQLTLEQQHATQHQQQQQHSLLPAFQSPSPISPDGSVGHLSPPLTHQQVFVPPGVAPSSARSSIHDGANNAAASPTNGRPWSFHNTTQPDFASPGPSSQQSRSMSSSSAPQQQQQQQQQQAYPANTQPPVSSSGAQARKPKKEMRGGTARYPDIPRPAKVEVPAPVPNLTKKSRGRAVPTVVQGSASASGSGGNASSTFNSPASDRSNSSQHQRAAASPPSISGTTRPSKTARETRGSATGGSRAQPNPFNQDTAFFANGAGGGWDALDQQYRSSLEATPTQGSLANAGTSSSKTIMGVLSSFDSSMSPGPDAPDADEPMVIGTTPGSVEAEIRSRPFVCPVVGCGNAYNRNEHLNRHIRSIHTNEKPFDCPYPGCGKEFNRYDNLCQHYRGVHRGNPADVQNQRRG